MDARDGRTILETERLVLREFVEADAEAFHVLGSHPEIIRYTHDPGGGLKSVEHAREILRTHPLADYKKHGYGRWACVHRESGELIGFAGLKFLEDLQEVDIGYRLRPEYWGLGLATEACRPIIDYGFEQRSLDEIIGLVLPENLASVRVLEKLGLRYQGPVDYDGMEVSRDVICG